MKKHLLYSFFLLLTSVSFAQNIVEIPHVSEEESAVSLALFYNSEEDLAVEFKNTDQENRTLTFDDASSKLLSNAIPLSSLGDLDNELEFMLFDVNQDQVDELIIKYENTIGAGPQAGAIFSSYYCFFIRENQMYWNEDNEQINNAVSDDEFSASQQQYSITELYQYIYKYDRLPIGLKLEKGEAKRMHVKDNEQLIVSVLLENNHRMSILVDEEMQYIAYRHSKGGEVITSYKSLRDSTSKFHYYKEDNWGYSRYFLNNLMFEDATSIYILYENYVEGDLPNKEKRIRKDGMGIFMMDKKSNELRELKTLSIKGRITNLKQIESLLSVDYECCKDYDDE